MKNQNRTTIITAIIFIIIQSLTTIGLVSKSKYDNVLEVFTITFLFLLFSFLKVKYNLCIKKYITWIVVITIIGHNLVGEYFEIYLSSFTYDKFLHFFGTYAFTLFFYSIIDQVFPVPAFSKAREFIFIVLLGITLGTNFEIIEFLVDVTFKPKIPSQDNLFDTDLDMIFNAIGALIAAIHAYLKKLRLFCTNDFK